MSNEIGEPSTWHRLTVALLGGLVVASLGFLHIAVVQPAGLDPPPETAALFLVAAAAATVSYLLVRGGDALGYLAGVLTGVLVVAEVGVVVAGVYGPAGPETNPVGPIAYVGLALGVVVTSAVAWRRRAATRAVGESATA